MTRQPLFTKLPVIILLLVSSMTVGRATPALAQSVPRTQATYTISNTLRVNYIDYYGPYYETRGSNMTIRVTWNPRTSSVKFGLCTSITSCSWTTTYTDGSGSVTFPVSKSGNYYLAIWNTGPEDISYSGSIDV